MSLNSKKIAECIIVPSSGMSLDRCITMKIPSTTSMIILIILSIVIYLLAAYAIYKYVNKQHSSRPSNYWAILGILILSGIIVSVIFAILK